MNSPDRIPELSATYVAQQASEIIGDDRRLGDYVDDLCIYLPHVCRAMREIDNACRGDDIAITAILTAMSNLQRDLLATVSSFDSVRDRANDDARQSALGIGSLG